MFYKNKNTKNARKKASAVSKKKAPTKPKKAKEFDPMKLSDEEFTQWVDPKKMTGSLD